MLGRRVFVFCGLGFGFDRVVSAWRGGSITSPAAIAEVCGLGFGGEEIWRGSSPFFHFLYLTSLPNPSLLSPCPNIPPAEKTGRRYFFPATAHIAPWAKPGVFCLWRHGSGGAFLLAFHPGYRELDLYIHMDMGFRSSQNHTAAEPAGVVEKRGGGFVGREGNLCWFFFFLVGDNHC